MTNVSKRLLLAAALLSLAWSGSCMVREGDDDGGQLNPNPPGEFTLPERIAENIRKLGEEGLPNPVLEEVIRQLLIAGKAAEPQILEALKDPNPRRRSNALFVVGGLKDPDLVKYVAPLIKDEVPEVALEAAATMCQMGYKDYIPTQIKALRHEKPGIRKQANVNLIKFTREHFGFHFDDPPDRREFSVRKWEQWWAEKGGSFDMSGGR